jgi:hypothetical protein
VQDHVDRKDYEHKNAAYGARVWAQALPLLGQSQPDIQPGLRR